jgi:hypothetical protein
MFFGILEDIKNYIGRKWIDTVKFRVQVMRTAIKQYKTSRSGIVESLKECDNYNI